MVADAAPGAAGGARALDSARVGRSRPICPVAVSAHCPLGVAALFAAQCRRDLPATDPQPLPVIADVCAPSGDALARSGDGVCEPPLSLGLYVVGLLGDRVQRRVV